MSKRGLPHQAEMLLSVIHEGTRRDDTSQAITRYRVLLDGDYYHVICLRCFYYYHRDGGSSAVLKALLKRGLIEHTKYGYASTEDGLVAYEAIRKRINKDNADNTTA